MRAQDGKVGGGPEWESNERDMLIEGAILAVGRNLVLGKFLEILINFFYFMHIGIFPGAHGGQKRVSGLPELQL